jgi:hypothetical protein
MSGCSVQHEGPGDRDAAQGRVLKWVAGGAGLLAVLALFELAALASGPPGWVAGLTVLAAAGGGAIVGFAIGFAVNWFDRLFAHEINPVSVCGCILCAGKNDDGPPPLNDHDWTFNLGGAALQVVSPLRPDLDLAAVRDRDAPGGGPAFRTLDPGTRFQALHCEISSHIGDYAAVGGAIGATVGAIAGAAAAAAICVALGLATFGIGAALCVLVAAIAILVGAAAGYVVGDLAGWAAGAIADEIDDFDERGEAIGKGTVMVLSGRWITDSSHQWNEIHDIESAQVCEVGACEADVTGKATSELIAAVGIGRHPTGRDP